MPSFNRAEEVMLTHESIEVYLKYPFEGGACAALRQLESMTSSIAT